MTRGPDDDGVPNESPHAGSPSDEQPDDDASARPSETPDGEAGAEPASQTVLELLAEGVPMALVADLIDPAGPPSPVILEEEGEPDEAWWAPDFVPRPGDDGGAGEGEQDGAGSGSPERDA